MDENQNKKSRNQNQSQNNNEQDEIHRLQDGTQNNGGSNSRRSSQQHPRRNILYRIPHSVEPTQAINRLSFITRPSPGEEERFRICIILIASWLFMAVSGLFLVCYVYLIEWSPETADPIHIFSLELAVCMLYVMFSVDIIACIAIIVSHRDYARPFRFRIFWPAVGFLCLHHIHGTFVWFWVWTGEFPRSCAQNSFYLGRRCQNLANLLLVNSDGKLRLTDCKCDYGACLPECKGLRFIQHYFWSTFWLYLVRTVMLVICIPWLREAICGCKCCCCIDPRDNPVVLPELSTNHCNPEDENQCLNEERCCSHRRNSSCEDSSHHPQSCQKPCCNSGRRASIQNGRCVMERCKTRRSIDCEYGLESKENHCLNDKYDHMNANACTDTTENCCVEKTEVKQQVTKSQTEKIVTAEPSINQNAEESGPRSKRDLGKEPPLTKKAGEAFIDPCSKPEASKLSSKSPSLPKDGDSRSKRKIPEAPFTRKVTTDLSSKRTVTEVGNANAIQETTASPTVKKAAESTLPTEQDNIHSKVSQGTEAQHSLLDVCRR